MTERSDRHVAISFVLLALGGFSCSPSAPRQGTRGLPSEGRQAEIRHMIKANFHFSLECFCLTGDPDTLVALRRQVAPADISVLVNLMADRDSKVASTAADVVAKFGEGALPALRLAAESQNVQMSVLAGRSIALIEGELRRRTPSPVSRQNVSPRPTPS